MIPVNAFESVEIEIEGSKLQALHVNGINHTFTFLGNNNKLNIAKEEGTPNNVTALFIPTPDIQFATHGRSLEGNFLNNFTKVEFDRVHGLAEHYNLSEQNINKIIELTKIVGQKAYEIAGKMIIPLNFTTEANLTKAGNAYINGIGNATTFAEIFDKIELEIRNQTGSGGAGDDPNHGVPDIES